MDTSNNIILKFRNFKRDQNLLTRSFLEQKEELRQTEDLRPKKLKTSYIITNNLDEGKLSEVENHVP